MTEQVDDLIRADLLRRLEDGDDLAEIERELGIDTDDNVSTERWILRTLGEVAAFFGYHEATIKGWRGEGMPSADDGWDLQAITRWRLARLSKYDGTKDESTRALVREKLRIEVERKKLDLAEREGLLVYRDAVEGELREMFSIIRARLQALPGEIAAGVTASERGHTLEEATAKINTALKELSKLGALNPVALAEQHSIGASK